MTSNFTDKAIPYNVGDGGDSSVTGTVGASRNDEGGDSVASDETKVCCLVANLSKS